MTMGSAYFSVCLYMMVLGFPKFCLYPYTASTALLMPIDILPPQVLTLNLFQSVIQAETSDILNCKLTEIERGENNLKIGKNVRSDD